MRVEEVVGRRIRDIRDSQGMTQDQLGQAIGELLGKPWPRQTVSLAEQGRRAFTAVELVALARVLGVYVGHLFTPPLGDGGVTAIELGPGVQLDLTQAMETLFERMDVRAAQEALRQLIRVVQPLDNIVSGIQTNAQFLLDHLAGISQQQEGGSSGEGHQD